MTEEVWKEIPKLYGYTVSSLGRVKDPNGELVKTRKNKRLQEFRTKIEFGERWTMSVARAIALAFIGPTEHFAYVEVIDWSKPIALGNVRWQERKPDDEYVSGGSYMRKHKRTRSTNEEIQDRYRSGRVRMWENNPEYVRRLAARYAVCHGARAAGARYGVTARTIVRWKKKFGLQCESTHPYTYWTPEKA